MQTHVQQHWARQFGWSPQLGHTLPFSSPAAALGRCSGYGPQPSPVVAWCQSHVQVPARQHQGHLRTRCSTKASSLHCAQRECPLSRRLLTAQAPVCSQQRGQQRRLPVCASLHPKTVFTVATLTVMPMYVLMMFFGSTRLAKRVVESPLVFVGLGALYIACWVQWAHAGLLPLLQQAVTNSTPLPHMVSIAALFQNAHITALAWVHLLLLDLYQAREVFLDGVRKRVFTAHSLVFCFMFGPSGVLCHAITKKFAGY